LEDQLIETMQREKGWALTGNLCAMVWLEQKYQLGQGGNFAARQAAEVLAAEELDREFLLRLSASSDPGYIEEGEHV